MIQGNYYKNNTYDELKTVVLGSYYTPDYFKFITVPSIREPLMRIADEINQDLLAFENLLIQQGSKVIPERVTSQGILYLFKKGRCYPPPLLFRRNS